jgi:hypothetical protein
MFSLTPSRRILAAALALGAVGATGLTTGVASAFTRPAQIPDAQVQYVPGHGNTNVIIYTLTPTERDNVCGTSRQTTITYAEPYGTYTVNCSNGDVDFQATK